MAEINLKKLTAGGPSDIDVNFNGTLEGQANALIPIDVNLTDGVNPVTPTSVALTGNDLDIVIPPVSIPSGVLFKTIEPTQYTSYRTGDEGWRVQNGFYNYIPPTNPKAIAELDFTSPNFFNVLKNPLVVNGVSSTTRFVDINGIQAFSATGNANKVVIDKLTGMMYSRDTFSSVSWNSQIDAALSYSVTIKGVHFNDWYLASYNEYTKSIHHFAGIQPYTDTLSLVNLFFSGNNNWTSTTDPNNTASAYLYRRDVRYLDQLNKGTGLQAFYITNARNLISAP
jgi:hypothetical protein